MKATLPETVQNQAVVDGHQVRFKRAGKDTNERAEVLIDGIWVLLWSSRSLTKCGKRAWWCRQQELVKAVWEKLHGHKPALCERCQLIVEGVDPRILGARGCRTCQDRSKNS